MNITRRIHLNPQSKGNLGKSFETEFRTAWLDRLGIPWTGSDLDDRHHTFGSRHPQNVRSYQLGNEHESKTALLTLFRRVLKDTAAVHVIDTRAQADALIVSALEELDLFTVCDEQGVRLTFFLFPTDDTESMTNVGRLFLFAGDRVDYIVVHNPARARGDLFQLKTGCHGPGGQRREADREQRRGPEHPCAEGRRLGEEAVHCPSEQRGDRSGSKEEGEATRAGHSSCHKCHMILPRTYGLQFTRHA